jgi:hypothetical protein
MDYLVTFRGYIVESKRPDGFPKVIEDLVFFRADGIEAITKAVNEYSAYYIRLQGMSVRPDAHAMEDFSIIDDARIWVPMHMLAYFKAEVKQLTGTMPSFDENGQVVLEEGQKMEKN